LPSSPLYEDMNDYRQILECKYNYCYFVDRGAYDEWLALFSDDPEFDRDGTVYSNKEELRQLLREIDDRYDYLAHNVFNPLIDVDGDTATGQWFALVLSHRTDGLALLSQIKYTDEYVREAGDWKIQSVLADFEFTCKLETI
jgi:hypothetical protein